MPFSGALEHPRAPHVLRFCCAPALSPCSTPTHTGHAGPSSVQHGNDAGERLPTMTAESRMVAALAALTAEPQGANTGRFPP